MWLFHKQIYKSCCGSSSELPKPIWSFGPSELAKIGPRPNWNPWLRGILSVVGSPHFYPRFRMSFVFFLLCLGTLMTKHFFLLPNKVFPLNFLPPPLKGVHWSIGLLSFLCSPTSPPAFWKSTVPQCPTAARECMWSGVACHQFPRKMKSLVTPPLPPPGCGGGSGPVISLGVVLGT